MSRLCLTAPALAAALLWSGAAGAFEIEHSETRYVDKRYQCDLNVRLDAPLDKVEAVLRDYEKYPSLDTRILQARVLERPSPNGLRPEPRPLNSAGACGSAWAQAAPSSDPHPPFHHGDHGVHRGVLDVWPAECRPPRSNI